MEVTVFWLFGDCRFREGGASDFFVRLHLVTVLKLTDFHAVTTRVGKHSIGLALGKNEQRNETKLQVNLNNHS